MIIGASFGGVVGFIIIVIGIIYVGRKQRLRLQRGRRISIDSPPGPVVITQEAEVVSGILTPLILPKLISQLRTPLTKSSGMIPPAQPPAQNEEGSTQPRGTGRRDDFEGRNTLADTVQRLQERVAYLEGRSSEESARDRGLRRMNTPSLSEQAARSERTSDRPPTYKS
jgi:hypothetical protein